MGKVVRVLLLLLVGLLWLGQFQRILITSTVAIYLHELLLFLLSTLIFVSHRSDLYFWIKKESTLLKAGGVFIGFIFLSLISRVFMGEQTVLGWLYFARLLLYVSCWPTLFIALQQQWITKSQLIFGLRLVPFGILLLGILQYMFLPDTTSLALLGWDDHALRAISTLFDPGFTAGVGVIGILMSTHFLFSDWKRGCIWFLGIVGLLLTYSRAGFLSFFSGLTLWSIRVKKRRFGSVLAIMFLIGIVLLPRANSEGTRLERTASVSARINTYQDSLVIQKPIDALIGKGWYLARSQRGVEFPGKHVHPSSPDNPFVHVFESLGVPGLCAFLYCCWGITRRFWKNPAFSAAWCAVVVGSFFNNLFFYPWILLLLMGMLTVET